MIHSWNIMFICLIFLEIFRLIGIKCLIMRYIIYMLLHIQGFRKIRFNVLLNLLRDVIAYLVCIVAFDWLIIDIYLITIQIHTK